MGAEGRDEDAGERALEGLLDCLSESACPGERLALAARFALLAARPDTSETVRRRALRTVQDLARRKREEAPCTRGLAEMTVRAARRR